MSSYVTDVWQCDHNVTLTLTLDPNKENKKKRKRELNKKVSIQALHVWQVWKYVLKKTKSEGILKKLDFLQTKATIIYTNDQGCIALASNPVSHSHVLPDILLSWNDKIDIKCSLSNDITCQ